MRMSLRKRCRRRCKRLLPGTHTRAGSRVFWLWTLCPPPWHPHAHGKQYPMMGQCTRDKTPAPTRAREAARAPEEGAGWRTGESVYGGVSAHCEHLPNSDESRSLLRGREYERQKEAVKTADTIAKEHRVGQATIRRDAVGTSPRLPGLSWHLRWGRRSPGRRGRTRRTARLHQE